jgi:AraC-like DNA-binding protein
VSLVALDGCVIERPRDGGDAIEVVTADSRPREFPLRLSDTLGVCLKIGPGHVPMADGREVVFPAGAVLMRPPGCVWSSPRVACGFVSIDIAAAVLPRGVRFAAMAARRTVALPAVPALARALVATPSALQRQELIAGLVEALAASGLAGGGEGEAGDTRGRAVRRAREFLDAFAADPVTLEDVAQHAGLNRFALVRQFRRAYGITPHAYQTQVRIARARVLLAGGAPIDDVALSLGFADQSHFGRHFKRSLGMSPARYARAHDVTCATTGASAASMVARSS